MLDAATTAAKGGKVMTLLELQDVLGERIKIATDKSLTVEEAFYNGKNWGDGWSKVDVICWMPLPQPPKEEK